MFGWLRVKTPQQRLAEWGVDPRVSWSDDPEFANKPGLSRAERNRRKSIRSCLRSVGRHANDRRRQESGVIGPKDHGMGEDGRQQ